MERLSAIFEAPKDAFGYRNRASNPKFYLDFQDKTSYNYVTKHLKNNGVTVQAYFDKNISCIVTSRKDYKKFTLLPDPDQGNTVDDESSHMPTVNLKAPLGSRVSNRAQMMVEASRLQKDNPIQKEQSSSTTSDILRKAQQLSIPIISMNKFCKLLDEWKIPLDLSQPPPNPANAQKPSSLLTGSEYRKFVHPFLKIEDRSGDYKPLSREYKIGSDGSTSWPIIYFNSPAGSCPFVKVSPRSVPNSDASNVRSVRKRRPDLKGYCECCKEHFEQGLDQHRTSQNHQNFAADAANYKEFDKWLEKGLHFDAMVDRMMEELRLSTAPLAPSHTSDSGDSEFTSDKHLGNLKTDDMEMSVDSSTLEVPVPEPLCILQLEKVSCANNLVLPQIADNSNSELSIVSPEALRISTIDSPFLVDGRPHNPASTKALDFGNSSPRKLKSFDKRSSPRSRKGSPSGSKPPLQDQAPNAQKRLAVPPQLASDLASSIHDESFESSQLKPKAINDPVTESTFLSKSIADQNLPLPKDNDQQIINTNLLDPDLTDYPVQPFHLPNNLSSQHTLQDHEQHGQELPAPPVLELPLPSQQPLSPGLEQEPHQEFCELQPMLDCNGHNEDLFDLLPSVTEEPLTVAPVVPQPLHESDEDICARPPSPILQSPARSRRSKKFPVDIVLASTLLKVEERATISTPSTTTSPPSISKFDFSGADMAPSSSKFNPKKGKSLAQFYMEPTPLGAEDDEPSSKSLLPPPSNPLAISEGFANPTPSPTFVAPSLHFRPLHSATLMSANQQRTTPSTRFFVPPEGKTKVLNIRNSGISSFLIPASESEIDLGDYCPPQPDFSLPSMNVVSTHDDQDEFDGDDDDDNDDADSESDASSSSSPEILDDRDEEEISSENLQEEIAPQVELLPAGHVQTSLPPRPIPSPPLLPSSIHPQPNLGFEDQACNSNPVLQDPACNLNLSQKNPFNSSLLAVDESASILRFEAHTPLDQLLLSQNIPSVYDGESEDLASDDEEVLHPLQIDLNPIGSAMTRVDTLASMPDPVVQNFDVSLPFNEQRHHAEIVTDLNNNVVDTFSQSHETETKHENDATYLQETHELLNPSEVQELPNPSETQELTFPPETFQGRFRRKPRNTPRHSMRESDKNQNNYTLSETHSTATLADDQVPPIAVEETGPAEPAIDSQIFVDVKKSCQVDTSVSTETKDLDTSTSDDLSPIAAPRLRARKSGSQIASNTLAGDTKEESSMLSNDLDKAILNSPVRTKSSPSAPLFSPKDRLRIQSARLKKYSAKRSRGLLSNPVSQIQQLLPLQDAKSGPEELGPTRSSSPHDASLQTKPLLSKIPPPPTDFTSDDELSKASASSDKDAFSMPNLHSTSPSNVDTLQEALKSQRTSSFTNKTKNEDLVKQARRIPKIPPLRSTSSLLSSSPPSPTSPKPPRQAVAPLGRNRFSTSRTKNSPLIAKRGLSHPRGARVSPQKDPFKFEDDRSDASRGGPSLASPPVRRAPKSSSPGRRLVNGTQRVNTTRLIRVRNLFNQPEIEAEPVQLQPPLEPMEVKDKSSVSTFVPSCPPKPLETSVSPPLEVSPPIHDGPSFTLHQLLVYKGHEIKIVALPTAPDFKYSCKYVDNGKYEAFPLSLGELLPHIAFPSFTSPQGHRMSSRHKSPSALPLMTSSLPVLPPKRKLATSLFPPSKTTKKEDPSQAFDFNEESDFENPLRKSTRVVKTNFVVLTNGDIIGE